MLSVGVHFRMWHTAVRVSPMQINFWQLIKRWDVEQGRHGQSAKQRRNIAPFTVGLASLVAPLLFAEGSMTNVLDNRIVQGTTRPVYITDNLTANYESIV
jgi:hypothetical protein